MKQSKIGLKDIAERAGVSKTAVSLILNGKPGVSEAKRAEILKIIEELNYRPSSSRGTLGLSSRLPENSIFYFIGFGAGASNSAGHSYYAPLLNGASDYFRKLGYHLSFLGTNSVPKDLETPQHTPPAGVIITGHPEDRIYEDLLARNIPHVSLSTSFLPPEGDTVRPDNLGGSRLATLHLIEQGHTKIAYIGGETVNPDATERYFGYQQAMLESGLELNPNLCTFTDFSHTGGQEGLRRLLESSEEFTAIYAGGDYLAIGIYQEANKQGLKIPDDFSIIGFDDVEGAQYLVPPLTTMHMDLHGLGERAAELLIQQIQTPHSDVHLKMSPKLVVRNSVEAPKPLAVS